MKKLSLFILLSICLISSSFAKQIICTTNLVGEPTLMVLHNPAPYGEVLMKKWLLDDRQPYWETTYESKSVIVLQSFLEGTGILGTIHITK